MAAGPIMERRPLRRDAGSYSPFLCTCCVSDPATQWVRYWKSIASKNWPRPSEQPIWQSDFWDTLLRRSENYDSKCQYGLHMSGRADCVQHEVECAYLQLVN